MLQYQSIFMLNFISIYEQNMILWNTSEMEAAKQFGNIRFLYIFGLNPEPGSVTPK